MIRYGLVCDGGHGFDGWFRSSSDFDEQSGRGLLTCPFCESGDVSKALMAPAVRTGSASAPAHVSSEAAPAPDAEPGDAVAVLDDKHDRVRGMLRDLRRELTKNSEDVGTRFPEIARKMHAEEIERRSIYGRATAEEAQALAEEGVELHRVPPFPDEMN